MFSPAPAASEAVVAEMMDTRRTWPASKARGRGSAARRGFRAIPRARTKPRGAALCAATAAPRIALRRCPSAENCHAVHSVPSGRLMSLRPKGL